MAAKTWMAGHSAKLTVKLTVRSLMEPPSAMLVPLSAKPVLLSAKPVLLSAKPVLRSARPVPCCRDRRSPVRAGPVLHSAVALDAVPAAAAEEWDRWSGRQRRYR